MAECHCGAPVDADRGRGMCLVCDDIRCDAYPGECPKVQMRRRVALAQLRDARKRMEQAEPDAHGDYYTAQREYAAAWNHLGGIDATRRAVAAMQARWTEDMRRALREDES